MRGDGGTKGGEKVKGREETASNRMEGNGENGTGGEKVSSSSKVYGYSSSQSNLSHRYGNSHAIWDHTDSGVRPTCHPAEVTFPPLPQPKLVLD